MTYQEFENVLVQQDKKMSQKEHLESTLASTSGDIAIRSYYYFNKNRHKLKKKTILPKTDVEEDNIIKKFVESQND